MLRKEGAVVVERSLQDAVSVEDLYLHRLPTVGADMQLYPMLDLFQRGQSTECSSLIPGDITNKRTQTRALVQVTWRWLWIQRTA